MRKHLPKGQKESEGRLKGLPEKEDLKKVFCRTTIFKNLQEVEKILTAFERVFKMPSKYRSPLKSILLSSNPL